MWGRNIKISIRDRLLCLLLFITSPLIVFYAIQTAFNCNCSILDSISSPCILSYYDVDNSFISDILYAYKIVILWLLLQLLLACLPDLVHIIFPLYKGGIKEGNPSPGGIIYKYNINGFQAWLISMALFIGGVNKDYFPATIIYDNWENILLVMSLISYVIATYAYIRAFLFPNNIRDCKFTTSIIYNYFMGIELNPRTFYLDWKLFLNGRPGIIGWSLINLSFAAAQYELYGYITNSMILVNFLQLLYIGFFFYRESWYINTLDISHDHFGWMFAFGDLVWLPAMYTLQALYLTQHPTQLSLPYFLFVLFLGIIGFYIFASSNNEKDRFRATVKTLNKIDIEFVHENVPEETIIMMSGKPVDALLCPYKTNDGKSHVSYLLLSGWWGLCRHINYTGDIILSLAYSLACGIDHPFPYFYVIYLTILLLHRTFRDETKCLEKYSLGWKHYCQRVRYRFIPYVI